MNQDFAENICRCCGLGELECPPEQLTGGFLHRMYSLFTTRGRYALKLLNPAIMQRETALRNYREAERLETFLTGKLPILPALTISGRKMQQLSGRFFYLYSYYAGRSLAASEIRTFHRCQIAGLLARLHSFDRRRATLPSQELHIDWDFYIARLADANAALSRRLRGCRTLLRECEAGGNAAVTRLPPVVSICHNDLDSKNVLWHHDECRIIDLECLSYSSPFLESYEQSLCWSGFEECRMDFAAYALFLKVYQEAGGVLSEDFATLYQSNFSRLEYLEHSLRRVLGIHSAPTEAAVGESEAHKTLDQLLYYHRIRDELAAHYPG